MLLRTDCVDIVLGAMTANSPKYMSFSGIYKDSRPCTTNPITPLELWAAGRNMELSTIRCLSSATMIHTKTASIGSRERY